MVVRCYVVFGLIGDMEFSQNNNANQVIKRIRLCHTHREGCNGWDTVIPWSVGARQQFAYSRLYSHWCGLLPSPRPPTRTAPRNRRALGRPQIVPIDVHCNRAAKMTRRKVKNRANVFTVSDIVGGPIEH